MDEGLRAALVKISPYAAGIAVVAIVARVRKFSPREDLRIVPPSPSQAALWLTIWIAWVTAGEVILHALGQADVPHHSDPPLVAGLLILGMVVLAPICEELVFRGLLFRAIEKTKLGGAGAMVVTAIVFAGAHFQYHGIDLVQILIDGLLLGAARWKSRSLPLPIAMHAIGNAVAAWQRFG